jgi:hypothetical protein
MGFGDVGKVWNIAEFEVYLNGLTITRKWAGVTIHHTAAPSLAQRLDGLTVQHIRNMQYGYENPRSEEKRKAWTSGPHLYTDDRDHIYGMCPLNERGVHAVSFNAAYVGIEMLGDYDVEDPKTGRGKRVIELSVATTVLLLRKLGLEANATTLKFHRDDPTTKKTCPGTLITKPWFLDLVTRAMAAETARPEPKVVWLPGNTVIQCEPRIENGRVRVQMRAVCEALNIALPEKKDWGPLDPREDPPGYTRVNLRPLLEAKGWEVVDHLADQNKIYLKEPKRS